jgi:hypothetical protein
LLGSGGGTLSAITVKGALDLSTAFATQFLVGDNERWTMPRS